MRLSFLDHRKDPAAWARELSISKEAVELYLASDVIDLHVDSFIWTRIWGYELTERHGKGFTGARGWSQVDLPRIREAAVTGALWVITTNPTRAAEDKADAFFSNLAHLKRIFAEVPEDVRHVRNVREYRAAKAAGRHGAFIAIQGGNALEAPGALEKLDDSVVRITLVHLSTSSLGVTSSPAAGKRSADKGLTPFGRDYVRRLNEKRIFVDLAHINRKGFFDAVEVHDRSQPLIVTHTGVTGVTPHWRNLDDEQLRAIADTGGTIGVMYQSSFLGDPMFKGRAVSVVNHLEHIVKTVGEDFASLGSDFDGLIVPPRDLSTVLELPRLVQLMLDRGFSAGRIEKILGGNFLRSLAMLRP